MSCRGTIFVFIFVVLSVGSCRQKEQVDVLSETEYKALNERKYTIDKTEIQRILRQIAVADDDSCDFDVYVKNYYRNGNRLLWITRCGVGDGADSLLSRIAGVRAMGFNPERFYYSRISDGLNALRKLDFGTAENGINEVYARVEYLLSKSYMRYCVGMRFGFFRPSYVLNRLETDDSDTTRVIYKRLFDIPLRSPKRSDLAQTMRKIVEDSVAECLRDAPPKGELYAKLLQQYGREASAKGRRRLLCNMERCRWKLLDKPDGHRKRIVINLPAQQLVAMDGAETLTMRIGCGTVDTKTPLLTSAVNRMDFNPQWVIPKSIVSKSIVPRLGDKEYFERNNYFVMERKTGKPVDLSLVTAEMLSSNDYRVVQKGGEGNSLGRVIFRFNNNFSVFMHDTSSPDIFERGNRQVSHGCIRVERPYDLAVFMLDEKTPELIDKIDYTMNEWRAETSREKALGGDAAVAKRDAKRYIRNLKVSPPVPLFITYYTACLDADNVLRAYDDIYGYDEVIYSHLKQFVQ